MINCPPAVPVMIVAPVGRAGGGEVGLEFPVSVSSLGDEPGALAPPPSEPTELGEDGVFGGAVGHLFMVG